MVMNKGCITKTLIESLRQKGLRNLSPLDHFAALGARTIYEFCLKGDGPSLGWMISCLNLVLTFGSRAFGLGPQQQAKGSPKLFLQ